MRIIVLCLFAVLVSSCFNNSDANPNDVVIFNDFENIIGYYSVPTNNSNTVVRSLDAHSGRFVSQTDSISNYSMIFKTQLAALTIKEVNIVEVTVKIKTIDALSAGTLVIAVDSAEKNYIWKGYEIKQVENHKPNEWFEMIVSVDVNEVVQLHNSNFSLTSYFLNTGKNIILVDDYKIKLSCNH
jgi:hypothetical protein